MFQVAVASNQGNSLCHVSDRKFPLIYSYRAHMPNYECWIVKINSRVQMNKNKNQISKYDILIVWVSNKQAWPYFYMIVSFEILNTLNIHATCMMTQEKNTVIFWYLIERIFKCRQRPYLLLRQFYLNDFKSVYSRF